MKKIILSPYDSKENKAFNQQLFDALSKKINPMLLKDSRLLDINAGNAEHSLQLVRKNIAITALTASQSQLEQSKKNIQQHDKTDLITVQLKHDLPLPFDDHYFDAVFCWGELIHAFDFQASLNEIDRVLKKGGILIMSEPNMHALQVQIIRLIKHTTGQKKTPDGLEYWKTTDDDNLTVTRYLNIKALKTNLLNKGYQLHTHQAGQFTELYTKITNPLLNKLIHHFNYFWFKFIKNAYWSYGNILIFIKS